MPITLRPLLNAAALAIALTACTGGPTTTDSSFSSAPAASSLAVIASSKSASSIAAAPSSSSAKSSSSSAPLISSSSPKASSSAMVMVSSSSTPNGCADDITKGANLYSNNCKQCHGDVPTNGNTQWANAGTSLDVFDNKSDGYSTRNNSQVFETLPTFIDIYMPDMNNNISEIQAARITAYITHTIKRPWCPGQDWPTAEQGTQSSSSTENLSSQAASSSSAPSTTGPIKVLAYSGYADDNHWDKHLGGERLKALGPDHNLQVTHVQAGADLAKINYSDYNVLVFIGTLKEGAVPAAEKKRIEKYMQNGGNFVGFYQAINTDTGWAFYIQNMLQGSMTKTGHAHDGNMTGKVIVKDHPIMQGVPSTFVATGRIGVYWGEPNNKVNVLMTGSGPLFDKNGTKWTFNNNPILWVGTNQFGGRTVFSALAPPQGDNGNKFDATPWFKKHMAQMIQWAAGRL